MADERLDYSIFNREERDICAHLFRLLLEDQPQWGPLCRFLKVDSVSAPRIYCEVALIRDAYMARKQRRIQDAIDFMCELAMLIADHLDKPDFTPYDRLLPPSICDPKNTHPKQISFKLKNESVPLSESDNAVYGTIQAMFNAKPDLIVCTGNDLFVYEAKYTEKFDLEQIRRTGQIARVWAELIYADLGFDSPPRVSLRAVGLEDKMPAAVRAEVEQFVTWADVRNLADSVWPESDFSVRILSKIIQE